MTVLTFRQPASLPPFPRQSQDELVSAYRIRAAETMRRFVLAIFDRYLTLKPRLTDDENIREARRWAATEALVQRAQITQRLSLTEQAFLFQTARLLYLQLEHELVSDLADRVADRAHASLREMAERQRAHLEATGELIVGDESGYLLGGISKVM